MLAAQTRSPTQELINALLSCGAHLDEANDSKETFDDFAKRSNQTVNIERLKYVTLKCLAARIVSKYKIPFKENVPVPLESFVQRH